MPKIVYIAGYGRSGSTVLATVLGAHPDVASVGEVGFFLEDLANTARRCSCGENYFQCPFWKDWVGRSLRWREIARTVRELDRLRFLPRLLLRNVPHRKRTIYSESQRSLLRYVVERTAKPIVVDSSKSASATAGRAIALRRLAGQDVYVLHLVRNGRETMRSLVLRGSNWVLEGRRETFRQPAVRAVVGWTLANLFASTLKRYLGRERYLRVRYEDFVSQPRHVLTSIGDYLGLDLEPLIRRIEGNGDFPVGHVVGGNRLRFHKEIRVTEQRAHENHITLTPGQRFLFTTFAGWLNRWYGY